jgi:hypothetical protein
MKTDSFAKKKKAAARSTAKGKASSVKDKK